MERTLVLIKPDGVARGIVGEILHRFERSGIKIVAMKLIWPSEELADKHYPKDDEYMTNIGNKSLTTYAEHGLDPMKEIGTSDPLEIGKFFRDTLVHYLTMGPMVAMVLEGNHAIPQVRLMTGATMPSSAAPGTIRGDFAADSAVLANKKKRSVRNLIHASGNEEEAKYEIDLWFKPEEIISYRRVDEDIMFEHM